MRVAGFGRFAAAVAAALALAGCGGGGNAASSSPSTPTPAPIPLSDVAYVPFADGIGIYSLLNGTLAATIAPPSGTQLEGDVAVDARGATLYADVGSGSSMQLIAYSLTSGGQSVIGSRSIVSTPGNTLIVPLQNGDVVVLTTPLGTSTQYEALYDRTLTTALVNPELTTPFSSAVPATSGAAFYAVDTGHYVDERTAPPFSTVRSSSFSGFVTDGPIVADPYAPMLYASLFDPNSTTTTIYSVSQSTLDATAVVRLPNTGQVFGAERGFVLAGVRTTNARLYVVNAATLDTVPVDLSAQPGTLVTAALSTDATAVISGLNLTASSYLLVTHASNGTPATTLPHAALVVGPIITR